MSNIVIYEDGQIKLSATTEKNSVVQTEDKLVVSANFAQTTNNYGAIDE